MKTLRRTTIFGLLAAALLGGEASAQEIMSEGATLGSLLSHSRSVVEGTVRSVVTRGRSELARVEVARCIAGEPLTLVGIRTGGRRSDSVPLAVGDHAILFLSAAEDARGDGESDVPVASIEGLWLGKVDLETPEGREVEARIGGYLATAGDAAARRAFLAEGLAHWSPRIAGDAAQDLIATGAPLDPAAARAVVAALDRNRSTFADVRPLVRLARRTGSVSATGPLLDILEDPAQGYALPDVTAALAALSKGRSLPLTLASTLSSGRGPLVRARAAAALGALGESASAAPLARAIDDPDLLVRRAAAKALAALGDAGVAPLERALGSASPADARAAASALASTGRRGVEVLLAREKTLPASVRSFVALVRSDPAAARSAVEREAVAARAR